MNLETKVFPNEETFNKIYYECLENAPQTTEKVRKSHSAMHDAFEEYISAIEEYEFHYAYLCGYEAGRKENARKR